MSEHGTMTTIRVPIHDGMQIELTASPGEITLSVIDWKPLPMRYPHWPAQAIMAPGHRATLVLWRHPNRSPPHAPRRPRVAISQYPVAAA